MHETDKGGRLITFKNYCTCGGFAWELNGRPEAQPHMGWCPQREEYAAWYQKRISQQETQK